MKLYHLQENERNQIEIIELSKTNQTQKKTNIAFFFHMESRFKKARQEIRRWDLFGKRKDTSQRGKLGQKRVMMSKYVQDR